MRIISLKIEDKSRNLKIEKINFKDFTLLVGASGVGKTQIINSIMALKRIANGESISGLCWEIEFETVKGNKYLWLGEFEVKDSQNGNSSNKSTNNKDENSEIIFESLTLNSSKIIDRTQDVLIYHNQTTFKILNHQSVLHLLKEESEINEAHTEFKKIEQSDQSKSVSEPLKIAMLKTIDYEVDTNNIDSLKDLQEDIIVKLYFAANNFPEVFDLIKERFLDIFPQVENVKIDTELSSMPLLNFLLKNVIPLVIKIKESGIVNWIEQNNISSGMFRTLINIAQLYLTSKGSVILIDEFENSLGVNCIDELTSDVIKGRGSDIQYIITSHHPYIINNIDYSHWKIVTRKGNVIKTMDAADLKLGKSKHDAFIQLINRPEYAIGINV